MPKPIDPNAGQDDDLDAADFLGVAPDKVPATVRLHPLLTNEEYKAAQDRAREKLTKERRAAAMREVEDREVHRLRVEEGLTSGIGAEDDIVHVTIDLPQWAPWIAVNGEPYWHGFTYPVPRHVQRSLAEQMQRARTADDLSEGKSMAQQYQMRRHSKINGDTGQIDNAPRRFDA